MEAQLRWRPIEERDAAQWAELMASIEAADQAGESWSEPDLREEFDDPRHDFARGSAAVFDGITMIGFCVLSEPAGQDQDAEHRVRQRGGVRPGCRGRGIGQQLMAWAEQTAIPLYLAGHAGRALVLEGTCLEQDAGATALFAANGYRPARRFHRMSMTLAAGPAPDLAPGEVPGEVTVRGFTSELAADGLSVRNESFANHWAPHTMTGQEWAHFLGYNVFRPRFSFLAYARGAPVSLLMSHEYDARTAATGNRELYVALVGTVPAWRGRGIATALLSRALAAAAADGFVSSSLTVDADSPTGAVGVYSRLGFAVAGTTVSYEKPLGA